MQTKLDKFRNFRIKFTKQKEKNSSIIEFGDEFEKEFDKKLRTTILNKKEELKKLKIQFVKFNYYLKIINDLSRKETIVILKKYFLKLGPLKHNTSELKSILRQNLIFYLRQGFSTQLINLKKEIETLENMNNQEITKRILKIEEKIKYLSLNHQKKFEVLIPINYDKQENNSSSIEWNEEDSKTAINTLKEYLGKFLLLYGGGGRNYYIVYLRKVEREKSMLNKWIIKIFLYKLCFFKKSKLNEIPVLEEFIPFLGPWRIGILTEFLNI